MGYLTGSTYHTNDDSTSYAKNASNTKLIDKIGHTGNTNNFNNLAALPLAWPKPAAVTTTALLDTASVVKDVNEGVAASRNHGSASGSTLVRKPVFFRWLWAWAHTRNLNIRL